MASVHFSTYMTRIRYPKPHQPSMAFYEVGSLVGNQNTTTQPTKSHSLLYQNMARRYDSSTTTFSPEGRLHQVEYAIEAINNAGTCVGILASDGVVLASERKVTSALLAPTKVSNIYYDDYLCVCMNTCLVLMICFIFCNQKMVLLWFVFDVIYGYNFRVS
jgi:hypothetical protein